MSWHVEFSHRVGGLRLDVELKGSAGALAIVGPNGSGKSTLLRLLVGAMRPEQGRFTLGDAVLFDATAGVDQPPEHRRIGYLPQGYALFEHLSVVDNVAFGRSVGARRCSRRQRRAEAMTVLDALACAHLARRRPTALSGGERQRVALARALLVEPRLLLLDEPMAALDAIARRAVRRFLAERLDASGLPSVVVTHDVRDVEALEAEVVVLDAGRVVQRGPLSALRAAPANAFVAEFVGLAGR